MTDETKRAVDFFQNVRRDGPLTIRKPVSYTVSQGERVTGAGALPGERVVEAMAAIQEPVPVAVSPFMLSSAALDDLEAIMLSGPGSVTYQQVPDVKPIMHYNVALDEVRPVTQAEFDELVAICNRFRTERDEARADAIATGQKLLAHAKAVDHIAELSRRMERLECTIIDKDTRIAELKTELAAFKASNVAPADPKPLAHDPFQYTERKEPWRMGPEGIG